MSDLDLALRVALVLVLPGFAALWKLAVVYRVTSTGYIYRSKGRWGETEIRPADSDSRK